MQGLVAQKDGGNVSGFAGGLRSHGTGLLVNLALWSTDMILETSEFERVAAKWQRGPELWWDGDNLLRAS